MTARESIGLFLIVVALVLVPVAWTTSRLLWLVAFLTLMVGGVMFFSARVRRRLENAEESEAPGRCSTTSSRPVPTDIHNYTGWRSGGRSETMDAAEGSDGE